MSSTQRLFSHREVAGLLGLRESRLRYWAQTGFINPSARQDSRQAYTFRDLVGIKAAKELLDSGIPLQRVRRNLKALREALPELEQPLTHLRVCSDGEHLVVSHREGSFEPVTGQLLLDFEIDDLGAMAAQILELHPSSARSGPRATTLPEGRIQASAGREPDVEQPDSAYGWFLRGCALDSTKETQQEAKEAYCRAIELDPGLAAAHTNLGNLYHANGQRARALSCYQQACALDPDQPEACYNLANLLEEEGELDMAIAEYRRVLRLAPHFKDAHFNLALTLERAGSRVQAMDHWQQYLELASAQSTDGEDACWVKHARWRLEELGRG